MDMEEEMFNELPGLEAAARGLLEIVQYPHKHHAKFERLGIEAPKGVLLYGPPGVGKTRLVHQIARLTNSHLTIVQGSEVIGPYLGESERKLRAVFAQAQSKATTDQSRASILFIDEIDALAGNREKQQQSGSEANVRVVAQLLTLMDGVEARRGRLVVIGATNLPNALDPALRRPGRFDREVLVDVPNTEARLSILRYYTREMPLDNVDLKQLAEATSGYVGADIGALCREAAVIGIRETTTTRKDDGGLGRMGSVKLGMHEFTEAMKRTVPALRRGLAVDVGHTRYEDIGGLDALKQTMQRIFDWPKNHAATMRRLGVRQPRGILMYGPPGCSKTTVVKAVAAQERVAFFSINGASVYSAYVGDAERTVRQVFRQARAASPSVVFFDEIDAIVGKRQKGTKADGVQERVLSTMLNEMDGVEATHGVVVVGATNRIDLLDAALLRPGRFDKVVYVPPPDHAARIDILKIKMRAMPVDAVDVDALARRTEGYSGADLDNVCREAALLALRSDLGATSIKWAHFENALGIVGPSLTAKAMVPYIEAYASFGG
ncbi:hypothetical protein LPJ59_001094 [Coemansia sp. RSA 2399]|nr:hypothetical protein LPJ59_001094 [Coemansia sp. RSA 2399]KAJ1907039.1 hypothetical protein LPJ81_001014 [Coemansia sp. IMI 209127]